MCSYYKVLPAFSTASLSLMFNNCSFNCGMSECVCVCLRLWARCVWEHTAAAWASAGPGGAHSGEQEECWSSKEGVWHPRQEGCTVLFIFVSHLNTRFCYRVLFFGVCVCVCEFFCLALQEKSVRSSREAVEEDLQLVYRDKQQKMNELDVVVPLRLHQVKTTQWQQIKSRL